ncbi:hypothetical protein SAMN02745912_00935 [Paramaledivibacter caminithermalis DSM 15212]|uniref:Uncharacterized protein n=2 Tax=Paramaledivibacter TaxID=1884934 RepID=A0A1M6LSS9_PARC5|nr:hypothetical protein SAMN02745912_00935 [Paramaledivibacter caminithermalis DSM 15212]
MTFCTGINIKLVKEEMKDKNIKPINEIDMIKSLKKLNKEELTKKGFDNQEIFKIDSMDIETEFKKVLLKRKKLPTEQLKRMGYSEIQITKLRNIKGNETLDEIRSLSADMYCYNYINTHRYDSDTNRTKVEAEFGWEWNVVPAFQFTDSIGVGWNGDFQIDPDYYQYWLNYHIKTYYDKYSSKTVTRRSSMSEKKMNTCQDSFDLTGYDEGLQNYFCKSGYGVMALTEVGKASNVKFSFKYGHNHVGVAPSVTYPYGVGFTFKGAEQIYSPPSVANSQKNF